MTFLSLALRTSIVARPNNHQSFQHFHSMLASGEIEGMSSWEEDGRVLFLPSHHLPNATLTSLIRHTLISTTGERSLHSENSTGALAWTSIPDNGARQEEEELFGLAANPCP